MNWKRFARRLLRPRGIELRQYSPELSLDAFLWMLFQSLQINVVVDVGARRGEYGSMLRANGYDGWILSFEPVTESFVLLQATAAADAKWRTFQNALGSAEGTAEINVTKESSYSSLLSPGTEYTRSTGDFTSDNLAIERKETIHIRRLDQVLAGALAEIGLPTDQAFYLKMDTQGFDLEVLRGASGVLAQARALQTEISLQPLYENMPPWRAAISEFESAGYAVSAMFSGYRDPQLRLSEMDCVMMRRDTSVSTRR